MNRQPAIVMAGALIALSGCGGEGTETAAERAASPRPSATPTVASPSPLPTTPAIPAPQSSAPLKKSRTVYWQNLKPGMCMTFPDDDKAIDVTVTDCRAAHHAEVTLRMDLPGEDDWPGDAVIEAAAAAVCEATLEDYVGVPFDASRLEIDFFTTERSGWEEGDHRLICLVFDPDAETTTVALKGSKQ